REAGSGGSTSPPGTGGSSESGGVSAAGDGGSGEDAGNSASTPDAGRDATYFPTGPVDYGGVGEEPLVPLAHTPEPVPPIIPMDCPYDPTAGYTEYEDSFVIQRPYDLAASDRFSYENGIYTLW